MHKPSSLPPLRLPNKNSYLKPMKNISKRLELYFKLRTSAKVVISHPIECLLPSGFSENHPFTSLPTAADVVMSPKPPEKNENLINELKFSRLIEASATAKKRKDNSFLKTTIKASEHMNNLVRGRRRSNIPQCKGEKKVLQTMHKDKQNKGSIPFLSEILNKVYKQSSKLLLSPNNFLEMVGIPHEEIKKKHSRSVMIEAPPQEFHYKTIDSSLQTERPAPPEMNNKRRVVYNRNSILKFNEQRIHDLDNLSYSSDDI